MKRPRWSVRALMVAVAFVAYLLASWQDTKQRKVQALKDLIARYADRRAYWVEQEKAMIRDEARELAEGRPEAAALCASQALYDRDRIRYFDALHHKFEAILLRPDEPAEPDPKPPRLSPRDYLAKVPYHVPGRPQGRQPMD